MILGFWCLVCSIWCVVLSVERRPLSVGDVRLGFSGICMNEGVGLLLGQSAQCLLKNPERRNFSVGSSSSDSLLLPLLLLPEDLRDFLLFFSFFLSFFFDSLASFFFDFLASLASFFSLFFSFLLFFAAAGLGLLASKSSASAAMNSSIRRFFSCIRSYSRSRELSASELRLARFSAPFVASYTGCPFSSVPTLRLLPWRRGSLHIFSIMFGSAAVSAAYGSFLWDMCGGVGERRSGRGRRAWPTGRTPSVR
mmetsp:Transcript_26156/g.41957  ORF Transcript_26156/g.41957 Transcript_26156/m.41957 type:complete len:252 (+) Transcript_26156:890-1645(+)